jgi:hypothetical protein
MNYEHDCKGCISLDSFTYMAPFVNGRVETTADLYCCPGKSPTIIARFGDDGPDYASFTAKTIERNMVHWVSHQEMSTYCEALIQGYTRAKDRGLLGGSENE